jgi:hypothetical protein
MGKWISAAVLALAACAAAASATPEDAPAPAAPAAGGSGWVSIAPEPVRIGERTLMATCSHAPSADPAYRFWFRQGAADGLVVFFDGGGACWDDVTCAVPWLSGGRPDDGFYKAELLPTDDPSRFGGIFELANPNNPLRHWSFVFVPYCTGDVHTGSNTARYTDPDTGESYAIEHRGADNFHVVLEWMRQNVSPPRQLVVAGSSAGAYGATVHFQAVRRAFPNGRAVMLADAGQGVSTQSFIEQRERAWGYRAPRGLLRRSEQVTPDTDLIARLAARYRNDRFAQFTTAHDRTQSGFYALMGVENACSAWNEAMTRALALRQRSANFRSYVAAGESHSILRSPAFYSEASGGAPFRDWFAQLINGDAPENHACVECQAAPTACAF